MNELTENQEAPLGTVKEAPPSSLDAPAVPRPVRPPPPTIWPFVTAVGMMVIFWGFLLDPLVVCVGAGVFLIGMGGLVGDWVREHRNQTT
jgi:hypothetical protein